MWKAKKSGLNHVKRNLIKQIFGFVICLLHMRGTLKFLSPESCYLMFQVTKGTIEKVLKKFFLGNGIEIEDKVKAANDLLIRDHPQILQLLKEYRPGKLGAYFVPPMFFGSNPDVLDFEQYSKKTKVNFWPCQRNLIKKTFQTEAKYSTTKIALKLFF